MEDDDEFGDLYTDISMPFHSHPQDTVLVVSVSRPFDLNRNSDDNVITHPIIKAEAASPNSYATAKFQDRELEKDEDQANLNKENNSKVLEDGDEEVVERKNYDESCKQRNNVKEDGEICEEDEGTELEVAEAKQIPGLSIFLAPDVVEKKNANFSAPEDVDFGEDDWESDSDDGLQIVLNDSAHDPMALDGGVGGSEDEGEPLVIVADENQSVQPEQEWSEDVVQPVDGEKKETVETGKVNGGTPVAPKVGYSGQAYHPYNSQFKYVRPGSGAPSVVPGGASNQVRPPVTIGVVSGRGRGEWRPPGIKSTPLQKNFHSGFGLPWGNSMPSRGFGAGLEFTLPSHKTIFEVDIDSFEEKTWKLPGIDVSDFFNFNLNEDSWKEYCKLLEQLRLEGTMQSKIRVYESGRAEKEYDPDLPPELAAAVGIHGVTADNSMPGNIDFELGDQAMGLSRVRSSLPTGRAIQVEGGYGERLPSIDTRPPRVRDSDAIIEIVLQEPTHDDNPTANGFLERPDCESQTEDRAEGFVTENGNREVDTEGYVEFPCANSSVKGDLIGRHVPAKIFSQNSLAEPDPVMPLSVDNSIKCDPDFEAGSSVYPTKDFNLEANWETSGRKRVRSPTNSPRQQSLDRKVEEPDECSGMDRTVLSSSPIPREVSEQKSETRGTIHIEQIQSSDEATLRHGDTLPRAKKQKLSSLVGRPIIQEPDILEDSKTTRMCKGRSVYRTEYRKGHGGMDEEVPQDRNSTYPRRNHVDSQRHEIDRKHERGRNREEPHKSAHHARIEAVDRHKEREMPSLRLDRKEHDARGGRLDVRKREYGSEVGSREAGRSETGSSRRKDEGRDVQSVSAVDRNRKRRDEDFLRGGRDHRREGYDVSDTRKRMDELRKREGTDHHNATRYNDVASRQKAHGGRDRDKERDEPRRLEDRTRGKHIDSKGEKSSLMRENHKGHDGELLKERDRHGDVRPHGNQLNSQDRRSTHEKSIVRNDRIDGRRPHERRHKDDSRQNKELVSGVLQIPSSHAKKNQGQGTHSNEVAIDGGSNKEEKKDENALSCEEISPENTKESSSGDEQRRGRSKLERWGSHTDRDNGVNREVEEGTNGKTSLPEQSPKLTEIVEERETETEKHMETVAKLKKRSERFKLPMPVEKEITVAKKIESEALPSEAPPDSPVKHERPARKRRWVGN